MGLYTSFRILVDQLAQDVAYAARGLKRAPMFSVIVAVTLSLGIGANAAVIGAIDTLFFRKLPVPEAERIVAIYKIDRRDRGRADLAAGWGSVPLFHDLRTRLAGLEGLALYGMQTFSVGDELAGGETWGAFVSGNYFTLLGITPQRGRLIRPDEEEPEGEHPVVVISDFLWRTKFDANARVLGRTIPIGKGTFTIIGVAPPGFTGLHSEGRTNLWLPYTMAREALGGRSGFDDRQGRPVLIFGRLRPKATVAEVQASADIAARELADSHPATDSLLALHVAVRDRLTSYELSASGFHWMTFVWGMVALLHLVACSNVASLMLARAWARRRELGIRICLGASRRRILVQSLTEATLLAILGAGGALMIGRWLTQLIAKMQFMSTADPSLHPRVVVIVALITVATVLQFGVLPALDASRIDPLAILRGASGGRRTKHSRAEIVVVTQIAISLLLIANATVFLSLFRRQTTAAPGYDADHLIVASIDGRGAQRTSPDSAAAHDVPAMLVATYDEAMVRAAAVPGVRGVAAAIGAPLFHTGWYRELIVPNHVPTNDEPRQVSLQAVGPGYFATIGASLVGGREFTAEDRTGSGARLGVFTAVVVNEALARRLWPNGDALGKRIGLRSSAMATVVGIVRDLHDVSSTNATPRAYFPMLEWAYPTFDLIIRVGDEPAATADRVRSALATSTMFQRPAVRTMGSIRDDAAAVSRVGGYALAACAGVALLLTSIGLYGLVAMWATARRGEIGIRLALGASSRHVHALLLSRVGRIAGAGAAIGMICAFGLVRVERGWIGPIVRLDALVILTSLATLSAIVGLAVLLPSLRATRQPPAEVLRSIV